MKINTKKFAWLVSYVIPDQIHRVERDLLKLPEFKEVEAFIPTVKILKKTKKGKQHFEDIPLLFNYGFFKIPRQYAIHPVYLQSLKENVACIFDWVKDPVKVLNSKLQLEQLTDRDIPVATALPHEISKLVKESYNYSAHTAEDLNSLKPGDFIILKGYPFEGVQAEFIYLNMKKKTVSVKIEIFGMFKEVSVAFDNVFFTVYHGKGYDDSLSTISSLDEMAETSALDKATFKKSKK